MRNGLRGDHSLDSSESYTQEALTSAGVAPTREQITPGLPESIFLISLTIFMTNDSNSGVKFKNEQTYHPFGYSHRMLR